MAANANPLVPPMDPRQMAAQGMPNPLMPPPPTASPSLGFQTWASDPQNAHKVVPAMTAPDAPLQPNAGQMASAKPPQQPPMASSAPPSPSPMTTLNGRPWDGMTQPGNLNIWNRPTVQNADGSHSTEYSTSFGDDSGREILVPTVVGGKFLTPDGRKPQEGSQAERQMFRQAQQNYEQTGQNLGTFSSPDAADIYAQELHNRASSPFQQVARSAQPNPPSGAMSLPTANPMMPPTQRPAVQSQLGNDQAELQRLQKNGAGVNQIHNGFLRGLAKVGDIAGTVLAPGVMAEVPGTTVHNWQLQNQQQGRVAQDQAALHANAQLADTESQTAQRESDAAKKDAQADSYQPIMLTAEQAAAIGHPELAGEGMPSKTYSAMLTGKQKTDSTERVAAGKNETTKTVAQGRNDTQTSIATARDQRTRDIADARNKTAVLMQGMRDNTSRANTGDRIAAKGTPGTGGGKVPADVTKRAALASNVNENADAVEKILSRRSDIVGAAGGRYTSVQQMVGSDDPDIQELGVRMHNIALASNGAHGLRSAEAVAQTEHKLFNNFKTGPNGIKGALTGTRQSVQTFLDDEKNFQTSGRRTGNPMQPPTQSAAPSGSQALTDNGVTYHIPANMVAEFKKDHPNAR